MFSTEFATNMGKEVVCVRLTMFPPLYGEGKVYKHDFN